MLLAVERASLRSGQLPVMQLKTVVLPAPLGPMGRRRIPVHGEIKLIDGHKAAKDLAHAFHFKRTHDRSAIPIRDL